MHIYSVHNTMLPEMATWQAKTLMWSFAFGEFPHMCSGSHITSSVMLSPLPSTPQIRFMVFKVISNLSTNSFIMFFSSFVFVFSLSLFLLLFRTLRAHFVSLAPSSTLSIHDVAYVLSNMHTNMRRFWPKIPKSNKSHCNFHITYTHSAILGLLHVNR